MDPWRLAITLAILAIVTAAAGHTRTQRTIPPPRPQPPTLRLDASDLPQAPPARPFFLLFTSRYCSACADTRLTLRTTAPDTPILTHNLSQDPTPAEKYAITQTPTLLLVDPHLRILRTHTGTPTPAQVTRWVDEAATENAALKPRSRT